RLRDVGIEPGMHSGLYYGVDDVAVEVGGHQPYVVAVVGQWETERRGHDARPQNSYSRHCFSSQKSEQSPTKVQSRSNVKIPCEPPHYTSFSLESVLNFSGLLRNREAGFKGAAAYKRGLKERKEKKRQGPAKIE